MLRMFRLVGIFILKILLKRLKFLCDVFCEKKKKKEFYWCNNYLFIFYMIEIVVFCNEEIYINVFWL